jgi:anti-sigma B factor antagonist
MSEEYDIEYEVLENCINISLSGEIDIFSSPGLREKLHNIISDRKTDLYFNFKNLVYIDSTGLGILIGLLKVIKQNGKNIYITELKDNILKLFVITGLDKMFMII